MKFVDVREKILNKLNSPEYKEVVGGEELILANGFFSPTLTPIHDEIVVQGKVVPMVIAVGKNTGKVHMFVAQSLGIK